MNRKKLRHKIFESGLRDGEVAEKVGIGQSKLSKILSGNVKFVKLETVKKMMNVLRCNASDMLEKRDMLRYQEDLKKDLTEIKEDM